MITIDTATLGVAIEHMRQAAPREGVGLLAGPYDRHDPAGGQWQGPVGTVDRWVPLTNVSEFPRLRFEVDPVELVDAWERLEADGGRRPWIVCHSHVTSDAVPSPTDERYAVDPTLSHMIVSLAASRPVALLWQPAQDGSGKLRKVRYRVADLGFRTVGTTDLTHRVSDA